MSRAVWKGPFVDPNLIKKVEKLKKETTKTPIKTWSRKCTIIPEFVGRLPVIATLEELDESALVTILTEPKNALVKQYRKLFDLEDVDLEFRDETLRAVAKRAMERKTGARGLRSILEKALLETMFELPSLENVCRVIVDSSVIEDEARPLYVYEDAPRITQRS